MLRTSADDIDFELPTIGRDGCQKPRTHQMIPDCHHMTIGRNQSARSVRIQTAATRTEQFNNCLLLRLQDIGCRLKLDLRRIAIAGRQKHQLNQCRSGRSFKKVNATYFHGFVSSMADDLLTVTLSMFSHRSSSRTPEISPIRPGKTAPFRSDQSANSKRASSIP